MALEEAAVPSPLVGRRVAILVGGGIAAYKVADLTSQLVQGSCQVRVAMTPAARRFVGAVTFQGLSGEPVLTSLWAPSKGEPHVALASWAQVILVAPATADLLARAAQGLADDAVTATLLAAHCPVVMAPAMNGAMWAKPEVQENVARLRRSGVSVIEPERGRLASGEEGVGRLPSPKVIFQALAGAAEQALDLAGRRLVVSAGGTRERIDPVRFVSNFSSGKMGEAVALAAAERGARVTLVSAAQHRPIPGVELVPVESAAEMLEALLKALPGADLLVMAAAVADFRPERESEEKIRREGRGELELRLVRNQDLLAEIAGTPGLEGVYRLGFAAEGEGLEEMASHKLAAKRLDAILANDIRRSDIAFGSDFNAGLLLFSDGSRRVLERMPKREMADRILDEVRPRLR